MTTTGLTDDEMRVRIALATGCKCYRRPFDGKVFLCKEEPSGDWSTTDRYPHRLNSDIPDYPNDLNAMHAAEGKLTDHQYECFILDLWRLVNGDQPRQASAPIRCERAYLSATARQRALAFLAMLPEPEAGR